MSSFVGDEFFFIGAAHFKYNDRHVVELTGSGRVFIAGLKNGRHDFVGSLLAVILNDLLHAVSSEEHSSGAGCVHDTVAEEHEDVACLTAIGELVVLNLFEKSER